MNADDWPRIKRVLAGALACEAPTARHLPGVRTDTALRERIDKLLAAEERVGTFLETRRRCCSNHAYEDLVGAVAPIK